LQARDRGLHEITRAVEALVRESGVREGLCTLFLQHTSASLLVQENAAPEVRRDLEAWLDRLVPEEDRLYTHDEEGPDDMPSHLKSALTATSLAIPILDGRLALGTWQGVFLWEHRHRARERSLVVHVGE
jgi:secondary thiamine-phosphate synthase enzyme